MSNSTIAFVGGGNMSRAIVGGLIRGGFSAADILISEPDATARESLANQLPGTVISDSNESVSAAAGCVVLAVKPQILPQVCLGLATTVQKTKPLIISIAAGVRSDDIDNWLGGTLPIVRVMPNQAALLGIGVSGLYCNDRVGDSERERAARLMSAVGSVVHVRDEAGIDIVTAVSGSGPAYFFLLIDMLCKAAVEMGLNSESALTLAVETAKGAAALATVEDQTMDALIARVRSPGGTTAAALDSLEADQVRAIFARAITAARDRAVALADLAHKS